MTRTPFHARSCPRPRASAAGSARAGRRATALLPRWPRLQVSRMIVRALRPAPAATTRLPARLHVRAMLTHPLPRAGQHMRLLAMRLPGRALAVRAAPLLAARRTTLHAAETRLRMSALPASTSPRAVDPLLASQRTRLRAAAVPTPARVHSRPSAAATRVAARHRLQLRALATSTRARAHTARALLAAWVTRARAIQGVRCNVTSMARTVAVTQRLPRHELRRSHRRPSCRGGKTPPAMQKRPLSCRASPTARSPLP